MEMIWFIVSTLYLYSNLEMIYKAPVSFIAGTVYRAIPFCDIQVKELWFYDGYSYFAKVQFFSLFWYYYYYFEQI